MKHRGEILTAIEASQIRALIERIGEHTAREALRVSGQTLARAVAQMHTAGNLYPHSRPPCGATGDGVTILPVVTIGPRNAELVTGLPWRWCRDTATRLGIPFVGSGQKRVLRADVFFAALEREKQTDTPTDPAEAIRAGLGKKRRVG